MPKHLLRIIILLLIYVNVAACASTTTQHKGLTTDEHQAVHRSTNLVQAVTDHSQRVIGKIDWQQGRIYSYGHGHMRSPAPYTVSHGRQYALDDARATMLDVIRNLQVDAFSQASRFLRYAVINRYLNERVKQANIEHTLQYHDDDYHVTVSLPLLGDNGLTQLFIPTLLTRTREKNHLANDFYWEKYEQTNIWPDNYSSVIIDARGLNYRPAMFASIVDKHGRSLYSLDNVDPNAAMFMLCEYTDSMHAAQRSSRAGSTPLIIKAQMAEDFSSVNYVLAQEDAEKLITADSRGRFLHTARVIVVIDD